MTTTAATLAVQFTNSTTPGVPVTLTIIRMVHPGDVQCTTLPTLHSGSVNHRWSVCCTHTHTHICSKCLCIYVCHFVTKWHFTKAPQSTQYSLSCDYIYSAQSLPLHPTIAPSIFLFIFTTSFIIILSTRTPTITH